MYLLAQVWLEMASPAKMTVIGAAPVVVTAAISGAGTVFAQETVSGAGQVIVGNVTLQQGFDVTVLALVEIAPAVDRPLPFRLAPLSKLMAPSATIIPWKKELTPSSTAPFICQNTLHKLAPLISVTVEFTVVEKAPSIWK